MKLFGLYCEGCDARLPTSRRGRRYCSACSAGIVIGAVVGLALRTAIVAGVVVGILYATGVL